ncbi:hypothetical protein TRFO_03473 [Tritrichomonas foetus]|uniref:Uncharacterized protein n=1 Tax=Tritrichomonas foetus TaxID=1144522 RepID=A0A1J4KU81_9EUKA|nr:hypothetical protein TRFO_03473 [Tritrichomonas foetus]|eukprot:OHT13053.1 hypothetical protein TRFO_03473 [Tritrichomonas foetus]
MSSRKSKNSETLDDLLGYLDAVESNMTQEIKIPDLSQAEELHNEVSNRISSLENTIEEARNREKEAKNREIEARQKLQEFMQITAKEKNELKTRYTKKINTQKSKYEELIRKNQSIIDELIKDKENLTKDCENLKSRAQVAREEATRREREVHEQAAQQIAQQRELAIAQERARQKKVLEQKIQEVKDLTVRGMEPELKKILDQQKRDTEALKAQHQEEIREVRASCERLAEEERSRLVEQLARERDSEFASLEQRLQRQLERERELHKSELDRMTQRLKDIETEKVKEVSYAKNENDSILNEARERWKAELAAEKLRSQQEIQRYEEKIKIAVENAKKETLAQMQIDEASIKRKLEADNKIKNEKKLKIVVQKLEADMNAEKKKIRDEAERKINLADLGKKKAISALDDEKRKFEQDRKITEQALQDEKSITARLESENNRLQNELDRQKQLNERLQNEINIKENEISKMRITVSQREEEARESVLIDLRETRKLLAESKVEMKNQKQQFEQEKKLIADQHAAELDAVSRKVKALIEGKENTIQTLKEQLSIAQSRLTELDQLFHQQKKVVLQKKKA